MNRRIINAIMVTILFFAGAAPALADDVGKAGASDGPPLGITPVTIKLQSVLDANDEAVGRQNHRSITDVEEGTIRAYGLAGKYRDVYSGLHYGDDYRSTQSFGPFSSSEGRLNGQRWHRDENGITNVAQDTVREDETDALSFTGETENPKNDVTLLGEVTSPVDAYVVQVKQKNEAPFWSFFDKKTGLLDRVEVGYSDDRETITYDDYRLANGVREAWHTHISDKWPQDDFDRRINSDTYGVALSPADLAIPPSRTDFVTFPAGKPQVEIPSEVTTESLADYGLQGLFSDPIIRVTINGRGVDMLLDSTETGIVLDNEVAREMGLTLYAPFDPDDKGNPYPTRTVVPSLTIGDLAMKNVIVKTQPYSDQEGSHRLVGAVGYDFLANAVVEIDYTHHTIQAYDPVQFIPPADSVPTPVNVDDGIPFVSAQIGDSIGEHFMLDDTAPFTMLYPDFWQAHSADVKDQGAGRFENYNVLGQDVQMRATQLKSLMFGGVRFEEWVAYEDTDTQDLEGVDVDGIIGCDFLQYFNVYFDYAQQQIYLEPNDLYKRSIQH